MDLAQGAVSIVFLLRSPFLQHLVHSRWTNRFRWFGMFTPPTISDSSIHCMMISCLLFLSSPNLRPCRSLVALLPGSSLALERLGTLLAPTHAAMPCFLQCEARGVAAGWVESLPARVFENTLLEQKEKKTELRNFRTADRHSSLKLDMQSPA